MKIVSYLKSIVIVALGLGVAPAQGMRKFAQKGKSLAAQFNRAAVNFGSPFARQSSLFRASGLNQRLSAFSQLPFALTQGPNKVVHSVFDAQPEVKVKSEQKPNIFAQHTNGLTGQSDLAKEMAKNSIMVPMSDQVTVKVGQDIAHKAEPLHKKIIGSGRGLQEVRLAFDAMQGKKHDKSEKVISRRSPRNAHVIKVMQANGEYVDKPLTFAQAMQVIKKPVAKNMYPMVVRAKQITTNAKVTLPVINNQALHAIAVLEDAMITMKDHATELLQVHSENIVELPVNDAKIMQRIVTQANNRGYVPFVVEEQMLPDSVRENAQVQLLAGSAESMVQLIQAQKPNVAAIAGNTESVRDSGLLTVHADNELVPSNQNNTIIQIMYDDSILAKDSVEPRVQRGHYKWIGNAPQQPLVILGGISQNADGKQYRVGYMSSGLAQTLFGNSSGLQWIGAFNTAVFMAIKKAVSGIAPLQPIDVSAENARIESMDNSSSKSDAQSNSGPEKGPEKNSDNTKNNQHAMNDQRNNDQRSNDPRNNDFKRNNNHDNNGNDPRMNQQRFDEHRNNHQDPRNNTHQRTNGNNGLNALIGTTPATVTHVADVIDQPEKDAVVVDITDPVVPEDPIVVDPILDKIKLPELKDTIRKPKVKSAKKLRQWTPCQNAVRMYGAVILDALQQGCRLNAQWAGSSRYIAEMIKNYNEQRARAAQNNHPEVIDALQYISYTIANFVQTTRAIMAM